MTNIYVGNLSYEATEDDIRSAFEAHGEVSSVSIIMDKMTGRSRGFGFVEMESDAASQAAIAALHERDVDPQRGEPAIEQGVLAPLPKRGGEPLMRLIDTLRL
jgi:RNA recognition motif-containing protein